MSNKDPQTKSGNFISRLASKKVAALLGGAAFIGGGEGLAARQASASASPESNMALEGSPASMATSIGANLTKLAAQVGHTPGHIEVNQSKNGINSKNYLFFTPDAKSPGTTDSVGVETDQDSGKPLLAYVTIGAKISPKELLRLKTEADIMNFDPSHNAKSDPEVGALIINLTPGYMLSSLKAVYEVNGSALGMPAFGQGKGSSKIGPTSAPAVEAQFNTFFKEASQILKERQ